MLKVTEGTRLRESSRRLHEGRFIKELKADLDGELVSTSGYRASEGYYKLECRQEEGAPTTIVIDTSSVLRRSQRPLLGLNVVIDAAADETYEMYKRIVKATAEVTSALYVEHMDFELTFARSVRVDA